MQRSKVLFYSAKSNLLGRDQSDGITPLFVTKEESGQWEAVAEMAGCDLRCDFRLLQFALF